MNWWTAFFVVMMVLPTGIWLLCEYLHAKRHDVLPKPQPDDRDGIERFRRICEREET
jgi:hypothetical protein